MSTDAKRNEHIAALSRRIDEIVGNKADFQLTMGERLEINSLRKAISEAQ